MKDHPWRTLSVAAGLALVLAGQASGAELVVGGPAPDLPAAKWLKEDAAAKLEKGKVYLIDFWGTWARPCRISIIHVNDLHARFKDKGLTVIGLAAWEQDPDEVEAFVKEMDEHMTYQVGVVTPDEQGKNPADKAWLQAAGLDCLPTAFLIDKEGRVAWIGQPVKIKSAQVEQLLDGTYDLKKAVADYQTLLQNEPQLVQAWNRTRSCLINRHWDHLEPRIDEMAKLLPASEQDGLDVVRFRILMGRKEYPAAFKLGGQISDRCSEEATLQNQIAWEMLISGEAKDANLELAEKIAKRANEAAKGRDAAILDTVARALFLKGQKKEALELQEKAVELADEFTKDELQATLESYKQGKLPPPPPTPSPVP